MADFVQARIEPNELRTRFSLALSAMYKEEVPLYGDLIKIVTKVDDEVVQKQNLPDLAPRHRLERHGAIRLGTNDELRTIGRLFGIFGMQPVGYYDLSVVGFPLHATAFRPISSEALDKNPFRVFTTLLRPDLLSAEIRERVFKILAKRNLFSNRLMQLIHQAEMTDSLNEVEIEELLDESLKIFKWHSTANVSQDEYFRMLSEHAMVADISCFSSAHINHLTPRTLDIDMVQHAMLEAGLPAKDRVEGPPRRKCGILLRQTSFKALQETVKFYGPGGKIVEGSHTARFGEVEQRGAAVTKRGRELYDELLHRSRMVESTGGSTDLDEVYRKEFARYPDDWEELRKLGLTYNYYKPTKKALQAAGKQGELASASMSDLIGHGLVQFEPITYEDFLPVSAAGIFTSNLSGPSADSRMSSGKADQAGFEQSLGRPVADEFEMYETIQTESVEQCQKVLGVKHIALD